MARMSKAQEFLHFWEQGEGRSTREYIESSCMVEGNDELANFLLSTTYERDLVSRGEVRNFLLSCQKSIQRILATI